MERRREVKKPSRLARDSSFSSLSTPSRSSMNLFELTRALIDVESVSGDEKRIGSFLFESLSEDARKHGGRAERMAVEPERFNVYAEWGEPQVTLSTHMDTVPPFFPSQEDEEGISGRGACDAKGIIAAMIAAAKRLLEAGERNFGLLFVVGEERGSAGAIAAAGQPRGSRYLINGEPTENRLAIGSQGALRFEIAAEGRAAHSAHPELGASAIDTLLDVLEDIRALPLPDDPALGRATLNIGTIAGGVAPNVIADTARAEIMFRLAGDPAPIRQAVERAARGRATVKEVVHVPAVQLSRLDGFPTTAVPFTTDIPFFQGRWGKPFLLGPGSARLAHTREERVSKQQLLEAVGLYCEMVRRLVTR
jgi:acetylornithine deacetylase